MRTLCTSNPARGAFLLVADHLLSHISECAVGDRLGYEVELLATLITPVLLMTLLLIYAKVLAPFAHREGDKRTLSDWPQSDHNSEILTRAPHAI